VFSALSCTRRAIRAVTSDSRISVARKIATAAARSATQSMGMYWRA
jgi:hypothetical protein